MRTAAAGVFSHNYRRQSAPRRSFGRALSVRVVVAGLPIFGAGGRRGLARDLSRTRPLRAARFVVVHTVPYAFFAIAPLVPVAPDLWFVRCRGACGTVPQY